METGGGESTSNSSSTREIGEQETTRNEIIVAIDLDSLHCSICTNPLCPPLYQCIYGDHIACFSCWEKVQYKCPTCHKPIGPQNIALEKILASIQLLCPNTIYGCCRSFSYSQMQIHKETCEFGPSLCPIPGCAYKAFSVNVVGGWRAHFLKEHWNSGPHYSEVGSHYNYGEYCAIRFDEEVLYYTLLGPGKDVLLLVKEPIHNVGDSISLYYIDLDDLGEYDFSYELEVGGRLYTTNKLRLESQVHSITEWKIGKVCGSSLLVPLGFTLSRNIKVRVLINKELDEESDTISSERREEEEEEEEGEDKEEKEEEEEEEEEDKETPAKKLDEELDTISSERPEGEEEEGEDEEEEEDKEPLAKKLDEESDTILSERSEEEAEEGEDEEEKKEKEEDKEPPAKKLDEESDTILSEQPEEEEDVNAKKGKESKEVKVQEEKEGKKKGKKEEGAAKPKNEEKKEAKASTSNAAKENKKPAAKIHGKEKVSGEVKGPTKEELHAVISELVLKVDLNTATLADIIGQLGAQFKVDLMDREAEVKHIIEGLRRKMNPKKNRVLQ